MMERQPIETAPMDGTEFQAILLCDDIEDWEPRCRFNEHGNFEVYGRVDYDQDGWYLLNSDNWQPIAWLPQPTLLRVKE